MTYFAVITSDYETIFGVGTTEAEAMQDAETWTEGNTSGLIVRPCSEALYNDAKEGGSLTFREVDGLLVKPHEAA